MHQIIEATLSCWIQQEKWQRALTLALVAWLFLICGAIAWMGIVPQANFGDDVFLFFDGGWRVLAGQRPHIDFFSSFGPVTFLLWACGIAFTKPTPAGFPAVLACVGLILGLWAYLLVRNRFVPALAVLFAAFIAVLAVAPYPLSFDIGRPSYAMFYNRLGYCVAALLLVEAFAPVREVTRGRRFWFLGGLSSGMGLALLLFLKVSFFVAMAPVLVISLFLMEGAKDRLLGMAAGFSVAAAPILAYLHFNLGAMLSNLAVTARARTSSFQSGQLRTVFRFEFLCMLAVAFFVAAEMPWQSRARARRCLVLALVTVALGVSFSVSNFQRPYFPLNAAAALILANELTLRCTQFPTDTRRLSAGLYVALVGWSVLLCMTYVVTDSAGIALTVKTAMSKMPLPEAAVIDAPHLRRLVFLPNEDSYPETNGSRFVSVVEEGLALVRAHSQPQDSVVSLAVVNPFSYALLRPPARGGTPIWSQGYSWSERALPPPETLIGDAQVVMVAKKRQFSEDPEYLLENSCRTVLDNDFNLRAESPHWRIYVRQRR